MSVIVKNIDSVAHTYAGQQIQPSDSYSIQASEFYRWISSDDLLSDIANGKAQINNGIADIVSISEQINYLKGIPSIPLDSDGSPLQRIKVTTTGWHYQIHGVEFTTSKIDSIVSKKADNSDWNLATAKFYKLLEGAEVEITGEDLNQTFLDENCIKTVIDWEPNFDVDIIGGLLYQASPPAENVHLWVVAAPDISEQYGGSKLFITSLNLKFTDNGISIDGKTPKFIAYDSTYHSGKFRIILRHPAGFQHSLNMAFEIFKL